MKRARKRALWAAGSVATAATLFVGAGWFAARRLTSRAHPRFEEPPPDGYESLRLRASDGLETGAWWGRSPLEEARASVVLVHGNSASRTELADEAAAFQALGCHVLPLSVRAHGDSEGERNDLGLSAASDVARAIAEARERAPDAPVVVFGMSLGAGAALFAVADHEVSVDALILIGPFADLRDAVRRRTDRYLPWGLSHLAYLSLRVGGSIALPEIDRIRPAEAAARIGSGVPTLIVAGGADDRAPVADSRRIARPLGAEVVVAPGIGHDELGDVVRSDAWSSVERFVRAL